MSRTTRKTPEDIRNDKMKRLRKAIGEKNMKVLEFYSNHEDESIENQELKYKILGSSGTHYEVRFTPERMSCTCPDHSRRYSCCKHIYLVYIKIFNLIPNLDDGVNRITPEKFIELQMAHINFMRKQELKRREREERGSETVMTGYRFHPEDECSICFDILGTEDIFGCNCCKNCFHRQCMMTITRYNSKCPMCRTYITVDDVNREVEEIDEDIQHITEEIKKLVK